MTLLSLLVLRLTSQHRALYCYFILTLWIFVLLFGMFSYVGENEEPIKLPVTDHVSSGPEQFAFPESTRLCNLPKAISLGSEGIITRNYTLEGVILLTRHGDRGPLSHVKNITNVNCQANVHPLYTSYEEYMNNITGTSTLSQILGVFHGFPPLPLSECSLGQLTKLGASQLLLIGQLLKSSYNDNLSLSNSSDIKRDVVIFTTRYRRTLQSALALLYSFLGPDNFSKIVLQESQSLSFCFDDCACPAADLYQREYLSEIYRHYRKVHPEIVELVRGLSSIVYEIPNNKVVSDPYSLQDALLTYVCHNSSLPCDPFTEFCVTNEKVQEVFSYIDWETTQYYKSENLKKFALLRSYGLIRNIVSQILRLISERRPKFVLYSGHDKTLVYLNAALGAINQGTVKPKYASRTSFEIYRAYKSTPELPLIKQYFFRFLFNGKDLTDQLRFCKRRIVKFPGSLEKGEAFLCPIESIIRFLHDDYFSVFNATNMKDACTFPS